MSHFTPCEHKIIEEKFPLTTSTTLFMEALACWHYFHCSTSALSSAVLVDYYSVSIEAIWADFCAASHASTPLKIAQTAICVKSDTANSQRSREIFVLQLCTIVCTTLRFVTEYCKYVTCISDRDERLRQCRSTQSAVRAEIGSGTDDKEEFQAEARLPSGNSDVQQDMTMWDCNNHWPNPR